MAWASRSQFLGELDSPALTLTSYHYPHSYPYLAPQHLDQVFVLHLFFCHYYFVDEPLASSRRPSARLRAPGLPPGQERLQPLVPYCPGSGQAVLNDSLLYLDTVGKGYLQISCSTSLSWSFWPKYKLATALLCRRTLNRCSFDLVAELMPILPLP